MLPVKTTRRKRSTRDPFLPAAWPDHHPQFRRLDLALPSNHPARWLALAVTHLDLDPLRRSYAGRGSQAYLPELLLAFVLFLYSRGVLSPAQWAREARCNDEAKWLLRGLRPSRSQLYTFRDRLGPFLDDWHRQLLVWAIAEGITQARRGSLDGTFVAALASRHRLLGVAALDRRLLLLRLAVWVDHNRDSQVLTPLPEDLLVWVALALLWWLLLCWLDLQGLLPTKPPAWLPGSVAGRQRVLSRYEQARQRLEKRRQVYLHKKRPLSKKEQQAVKRLKVSLSDPDAALGRDKEGIFRPLFNLPLVQATDAPLTLAWEVVSCCNDQGLMRPMLEKTQRQLGRHLEEVLVDEGFLSIAELQWCEDEKIVVYSASAKEERQSQGKGKLPKQAFVYDEDEGVYYCPQGQRLEPVSRTREKRQGGVEWPVVVYRCSGEHCSACPQQKGCTSNPSKGRVVKRYQGEEVMERLEERMKEPLSKEVYKQRSQTVELAYADLKEHRGLRVFRCYGKERARTQAGLVILGSNGLRICRALELRQKDATSLAPAANPP